MSIDKTKYFNNILTAIGSGIALLIAYQTDGLNMTASLSDFITWLVWLSNFIGFILIIKLLYPSISIRSVMDGVWGGLALSVMIPILKLPFSTSPLDAIKASTTYLIFGFMIILIGYWLRIRTPNQTSR